MKRIAKFYKVSKERFTEDLNEAVPGFTEAEINEIYEQIKLPKRPLHLISVRAENF